MTEADPRAELARRMAVLDPHVYDGVPLPAAAKQAGVPLRTAQRWLAQYRANGSAGLMRSRRSDRGDRKVPSELVELIEGLALRRPPPLIAQVHRQIAPIAAERGLPAPSYQSVRRIIRAIDPGPLAITHGTKDAYRDNYELVSFALNSLAYW